MTIDRAMSGGVLVLFGKSIYLPCRHGEVIPLSLHGKIQRSVARRWQVALAAVAAAGAMCAVGIPATASPGTSARGVTDLRVDTLTDPVGLGDATPKMGKTIRITRH